MSSFSPLRIRIFLLLSLLVGSEIALESRRSFIPIGMGQMITRRLRPARACSPTPIPLLSQPRLQDTSFYLCSGGMFYSSQVSRPKTGVRQCDGSNFRKGWQWVDCKAGRCGGGMRRGILCERHGKGKEDGGEKYGLGEEVQSTLS
jgi:hypothetical protein